MLNSFDQLEMYVNDKTSQYSTVYWILDKLHLIFKSILIKYIPDL